MWQTVGMKRVLHIMRHGVLGILVAWLLLVMGVVFYASSSSNLALRYAVNFLVVCGVVWFGALVLRRHPGARWALTLIFCLIHLVFLATAFAMEVSWSVQGAFAFLKWLLFGVAQMALMFAMVASLQGLQQPLPAEDAGE